MYYVYMSFPQIRHCNIAPLHQLGICHNNLTVDNTFQTMYVCMYVYLIICGMSLPRALLTAGSMRKR